MSKSLLLALLAGLATSIAWWMPNTVPSALFAALGAVFIVAFANSERAAYPGAFVLGSTIYCLGFYWLFTTIKDFGGYDSFGAAMVFALFVALSANQQIVFWFVRRNLPLVIDELGLRTATAWVTSEFFSVRIFPWLLGHPQIAVTPLVQIADLFGAPVIGFLQLWLIESLWISVKRGKLRPIRLAPIALFVGSIVYGWVRIGQFIFLDNPRVEVALVQANITTQEKHNIKFFARNRERYEELSAPIAAPGKLIVWPESVITDFIRDDIRHRADDPLLPDFGPGVSMLVGALTARSRDEMFNSAVGVAADGSVFQPYHKRILMPFGEYMPFVKYFPWLKDMNPTAGDFTAGQETGLMPFSFTASGGEFKMNVAPLICYEDIAPELAREATLRGAHVLINITNDAWFGKTVAPNQHHIIAAFRAIENRRYLLRSTNSGLTAVVNAAGETVASLPGFSDGVLEFGVRKLETTTFFTRYFGNQIWWGLGLLSLIISLCSATKLSISRKR